MQQLLSKCNTGGAGTNQDSSNNWQAQTEPNGPMSLVLWPRFDGRSLSNNCTYCRAKFPHRMIAPVGSLLNGPGDNAPDVVRQARYGPRIVRNLARGNFGCARPFTRGGQGMKPRNTFIQYQTQGVDIAALIARFALE